MVPSLSAHAVQYKKWIGIGSLRGQRRRGPHEGSSTAWNEAPPPGESYRTNVLLPCGAGADRYTFTSALPLQILRILGPTFEGLLAVAAPAEP